MFRENLNLIEAKKKKAQNDKMLDDYDQRRNAANLKKQMEDEAERQRQEEEAKRKGWQKALDNQINEKNQKVQMEKDKNEVCEKNYVELINKIKAKKSKELIDEFLEMRLDISKRIEELEDYFDENFWNIRMNILEKGIQLKKLLFYNPDKNNDQEEADLPEFTGLVMDFRKIKKNSLANQEFAKHLRQSNIKGSQDAKMRATMRATMRSSKYPQNVRKTMSSNLRETNTMFWKNKGYRDKEEIIENDNAEEDDFGGKTVKKRLRIRLTDEEYRLLLKLKAKKKNAQQQQ